MRASLLVGARTLQRSYAIARTFNLFTSYNRVLHNQSISGLRTTTGTTPGAPCWRGLVHAASGRNSVASGLFASTSTRSIWRNSAPWKELTKDRPWRLARSSWPGCHSWTQMMRQNGIRGYLNSSFNQFGRSDAQVAVWSLIGANLLVFGLWQVFDRDFMIKNFMVSVDSVFSGRLHTLVTSAFSHIKLDHLLPNMLGLYFFGSEIAQLFGGKWLINLYLAGAIAGSLGHVAYCVFVIPWLEGIPRSRFNPRYTPSALGASGAVNAIVLLQILLFPTRTIMVNFFIPVPAALFGAYLIGTDIWQARNEGSRTAHAGHLGGALVGAAAWLRVRRQWR